MSHDQRPARVRVVGNKAPTPRRRADDAVDAPIDAATGAGSAGKSALAIPAGLFLIGCAAGGIAVAALHAAG